MALLPPPTQATTLSGNSPGPFQKIVLFASIPQHAENRVLSSEMGVDLPRILYNKL